MHQIFVFSGTGNTWHLAKRTGQLLGDAELVFLSGLRHDAAVLAQGDTVGIASPVYAGGLPSLVKSFLAKVVLRRGAWSYLLLTHGGRPFGAGRQGARILREQGVALDAVFSVAMPPGFPPRLGGIFARRPEGWLAREEESAAAVAEAVRERRGGGIEGAFSWITDLFHEGLLARRRRLPFRAEGHCTGCGTCREVCPVENVVMDGMHRPRWLGSCEGCGACYAWCPVGAIRVGRFPWGGEPYHHPGVSLGEMRGGFRKKPFRVSRREEGPFPGDVGGI